MSDRRSLQTLVEGCAHATCRADVDGALTLRHPDFRLETVSFGLRARVGRDPAHPDHWDGNHVG